ncbi:MAG: hypothetical protein K8S54_10325, partial [Spirochaetia bacterium]|nr:hypothetical protein [Spirochaetia bacterium]
MRPGLRIVCRGVWLLNALLLGALAAAAQPSHILADVSDLSHFGRITRFARSIVGSKETLIVETRNESRTLVLPATLELPRIEIQAPAAGIGLVREGQQVARAQPLFQMDTSQLRREYALLAI